MKKVLGYIFKDWKVFDYIVPVLYALFIILFHHYFTYSLTPALYGICLVMGAIYLPKRTILGNVIALGSLGILAYFEFKSMLYGSFIATIVIGCVVIYSLINLLLKKESEQGKLDRWDWIILVAGLALASFPSYLLMVHMDANVVIAQALQLVAAVALVFLKLKNVWFRSIVYFCCYALELASFIMLVVSLQVEIASLLGPILFIFAISLKELIMSIPKKQKKE